jgi:hypothetical protein
MSYPDAKITPRPNVNKAPTKREDLAVVGSVVEPETLRRAMLHRATLSLQVAASAELCHDYSLRDFALNNFTRRWNAQTLYDPDGHVPS